MNKGKDNINYLLNELKKEQQEIKDELVKQKKKSKRFSAYILILALLFSGITSVASYSMGANSVAYTPKDASWEVENTQEAIDNLFDSVGSALVGSVYSYMGVNAPAGYLACDGTVYEISKYPRLANHIKVQFGTYNFFGGDGETTFAVPDLRGEFLRGTGTNSHADQGNGDNVGYHQDGTIIPMSWSDSNNFGISGRNNGGGSANSGAQNLDSYVITGFSRYIAGSTWGGASSRYGNLYTARPTNTSVLFIIKY
ncbi:MAG: tail fiber protein [Bacilli bacterium]|nr:tail fiber protein [Bacilli bacterium]